LVEKPVGMIFALFEKYSVNMHLCVSGYFIYDFFDMVINQKISHSWELLFHHVVVSRHKIW